MTLRFLVDFFAQFRFLVENFAQFRLWVDFLAQPIANQVGQLHLVTSGPAPSSSSTSKGAHQRSSTVQQQSRTAAQQHYAAAQQPSSTAALQHSSTAAPKHSIWLLTHLGGLLCVMGCDRGPIMRIYASVRANYAVQTSVAPPVMSYVTPVSFPPSNVVAPSLLLLLPPSDFVLILATNK